MDDHGELWIGNYGKCTPLGKKIHHQFIVLKHLMIAVSGTKTQLVICAYPISISGYDLVFAM